MLARTKINSKACLKKVVLQTENNKIILKNEYSNRLYTDNNV